MPTLSTGPQIKIKPKDFVVKNDKLLKNFGEFGAIKESGRYFNNHGKKKPQFNIKKRNAARAATSMSVQKPIEIIEENKVAVQNSIIEIIPAKSVSFLKKIPIKKPSKIENTSRTARAIIVSKSGGIKGNKKS